MNAACTGQISQIVRIWVHRAIEDIQSIHHLVHIQLAILILVCSLKLISCGHVRVSCIVWVNSCKDWQQLCQLQLVILHNAKQ